LGLGISLLDYRLLLSALIFKTSIDSCIYNVYNTSMVRKRHKQFLIWLDESIHSRLKKLAEKEGRSVSELIREAIADLLSKREIEQILKKRRK
jgi:cytidylate kinase